jgi:ABC-type proline/glycine betaine transport system ATPase subunit
LLGGRSVLEREPNELRREIGYVIQQIGLFPHLTVEGNIATVPHLLDWDKSRIEARVKEMIEGRPGSTLSSVIRRKSSASRTSRRSSSRAC